MADYAAYPRVKETSTTTGTGTLTLAGAVTGFQSFAAVGNATKCFFFIEGVDANSVPTGEWEESIGTYTVSGTTLSRTTVIKSSNSNALVSFSAGTKRVDLTWASSQCNSFGAAGATSYPGAVPNPGSSVHTPPWLLGDDAAFHLMNGGGTLVFTTTSTPAALTSTSETDFDTTKASYTVGANTVSVGDTYVVKLAGFYSGTVLPTIRGKVYFGTTVVADTTAITGLVTGTNLPWRAEITMTVRATGATGTLQAEAKLEFSTAATAALTVLVKSAAYTIDFTTTNIVKVSIQWGAGGAGQTITLDDMSVFNNTAQAAAGTVTSISSPDASITFATPTSTPTGVLNRQWFGHIPLLGGFISCSIASNALTISVLNVDSGAAPSSSHPVGFVTSRNYGGYVTLTSATTIVVSSGSTLGVASGTAFRLWIVGVSSGAGVFQLGVINCRKTSTNGAFPLRDDIKSTTTAEGGAGAADSAQVIYTTTAVGTASELRILGYFDWESGLTTAGTWDALPTYKQQMSVGVTLPGNVVQDSGDKTDTSLKTGSTVIPLDDTIPQKTEGDSLIDADAFTPTSAANILEVTLTCGSVSNSAAVFGITLFQDAASSAISGAFCTSGTYVMSLVYRLLAGSTSATTFKSRFGGHTGTTYVNGITGSRYWGGVAAIAIRVREYQG